MAKKNTPETQTQQKAQTKYERKIEARKQQKIKDQRQEKMTKAVAVLIGVVFIAVVAGSIAFPAHGTTEANKELVLLAVPSEGYTFNHWERNGVNISDSRLLKTEVTPLSEKEESAVYTAVFTAN